MLAKCAAILLGRNPAQNTELRAFGELAGFGKAASALSWDTDAASWPTTFYLYHHELGGHLLAALVRAQRADHRTRLRPAVLLMSDISTPLHPDIAELGFDEILPLSGDANVARQHLGTWLEAPSSQVAL